MSEPTKSAADVAPKAAAAPKAADAAAADADAKVASDPERWTRGLTAVWIGVVGIIVAW